MAQSIILEIRQNLEQSRAETLSYLRSIDEPTALFRARPDAWSVKDHVIHMADVEESVIHFSHRILHENCPISPLCYDLAFNQDAWNNRGVAEKATYTWQQTLQTLHHTREELYTLLGRIPEDALNRVGSHPVWGTPVTLASVLRVPYRHERAHRDEIAILASMSSQHESEN
ncbi:MAG: DinB family protein [Anaerolineae bacterium]|nr:DinB family protein [Anaerolineae bacterium]